MNDHIIPIVRSTPSRSSLRVSFFVVTERIAHLVECILDALECDNNRFFEFCDELRSEISEITDICNAGSKYGLFPTKQSVIESLRMLYIMVSHMELMFLYARKNQVSAGNYRKEIITIADEFLGWRARIVASIAWP